jgi:hypothetical protein
MLSLTVVPALSRSQLEWPSASLAALVKLNVMQAFCPQRPSPGTSRGGEIDAGPAAHDHSAGDDARRGH